MSFGSVIGAIVSQKNNRRTRTAKTDKFLATTGSGISGVKSHRNPTGEELKELRKKMLSAHKKRQRKIVMITAGILFLLAVVFFYFMFW
jgi:predicted nucleic acid-binding Zn ribbon protein